MVNSMATSAIVLDHRVFPAVCRNRPGPSLSYNSDRLRIVGMEVKLVYFCDKLTEGDRIVPLEETIFSVGKRYQPK